MDDLHAESGLDDFFGGSFQENPDPDQEPAPPAFPSPVRHLTGNLFQKRKTGPESIRQFPVQSCQLGVKVPLYHGSPRIEQ